MNIKKHIYSLCAILATVAGTGMLTGCSDFLKEHSQDLAKVESWKDLDEVLIGDAYVKTGVMDMISSSNRDFGLDILHIMSDEMTMGGESYSDYAGYRQELFQFYAWQPDCGVDFEGKYTGVDSQYWNGFYERINICNMVIALIDEQPEKHSSDRVEKLRVKGEAHFLRGFYYFMLANLYCKPYSEENASTYGMPLKLTEYVEDIEYSRGTLEETYAQILSDLSVAEECLSLTEGKSIFRADINAVCLLKSRVYLYMQNWEKAAEYAQEVIRNHGDLLDFRGVTPGENCVSSTSPETILSMGDYNVAVAFADSRSSEASYCLSDEIIEKYRETDLRKNRFIGTAQYYRTAGAFIKYNGQRDAWGPYADYGSVLSLRSPEAYLTYAEASAYLGREGDARETLGKFLKTRMNVAVDVQENGRELIDLIRDERCREFLLEGHRWFDLRRYTVCGPYRWSKEIVHKYPILDSFYLDHFECYRLEEYDEAYTLAVPRDVLNYQVSLGTIARPVRAPFATEMPEDSGWDDWDW